MKMLYNGSGIPKMVFSRDFKKYPRCCNECVKSLIVGTRKQEGSDYELEFYCMHDDCEMALDKETFCQTIPKNCPDKASINQKEERGRLYGRNFHY